MGFLKKIFSKDNMNQRQILYGPPQMNMDVNRNNEITIRNKCHEIMKPDPFWGDLLIAYMNDLYVSYEKKMEYLNKLATDRDIIQEFSKYLVRKNYDIPDAIVVNGKTAKMIHEENPKLTAIEIYLKLIDEKNC